MPVQEATRVVSGSVGAGPVHRVETVNAPGPLGSRKLAGLPDSITVVPAKPLENVQAQRLGKALKPVPPAPFQEQQGPEVLRPATGGMRGGNDHGTRLDQGRGQEPIPASPARSVEQTRDRVMKCLPSPAAREKPSGSPSPTSRMSWVCFHRSYWRPSM